MNGGAALCVLCDRPFCRHGAAYYRPTYAELDPIETQVGEDMRQRALTVLTDRYRVLAESSKTYSFSPIEGTVMEATAAAIERLQAMTPTGELVPARAREWWGGTLERAVA